MYTMHCVWIKVVIFFKKESMLKLKNSNAIKQRSSRVIRFWVFNTKKQQIFIKIVKLSKTWICCYSKQEYILHARWWDKSVKLNYDKLFIVYYTKYCFIYYPKTFKKYNLWEMDIWCNKIYLFTCIKFYRDIYENKILTHWCGWIQKYNIISSSMRQSFVNSCFILFYEV